MRRALAVAVIVTVAGGVFPAGGAVGAPARHPELAGTTRISGETTASTIVTLSRPVVVERDALDESVRVSGTGPLAGAILRQDARRPAELMALSIDPCSAPPCNQRRGAWNDVSAPGSHGRKQVVLPAGRYFLYFIAEGGAAQVTLRLDGLGGATSLRPTRHAGADFDELDELGGGPAGPAYRAAGAFELARSGLRLTAVELDVAPHLVGRYYSCLRPAVAPTPSQLRALTCAGMSSWLIITPQAKDARVRLVSLTTLGKGAYEDAIGFDTAAVAEGMSSFGFSLSYDGRDTGDRWFSQGIEHEERP